MRQFQFRARRIDNGKWVYGHYFKTPLTDENSGTTPDKGWFFLTGETRHCISENGVVFVIDENTLGEFTGLTDRHGKEMFDGDILSAVFHSKEDKNDSEWQSEKVTAVIEWRRYKWAICFGYSSKSFDIDGNKEICWYQKWQSASTPGAFQKLTDLEVLANIHENPELLR